MAKLLAHFATRIKFVSGGCPRINSNFDNLTMPLILGQPPSQFEPIQLTLNQ